MSDAPYSTIITVLEKYGEVDIDLLANLIGREVTEISDYLQTLQKEGIVSLQDYKVRLVKRRGKP